MIIYFSGGGGARRFMPEHSLHEPAVMPSYFTNVLRQNGNMDQRCRLLFKYRRKKRKKAKR